MVVVSGDDDDVGEKVGKWLVDEERTVGSSGQGKVKKVEEVNDIYMGRQMGCPPLWLRKGEGRGSGRGS